MMHTSGVAGRAPGFIADDVADRVRSEGEGSIEHTVKYAEVP